MKSNILFVIILAIFSLPNVGSIKAQGISFDIFKNLDSSKSEKQKEKKLGSEKSADKKFTKLRRFTSNNITHYNYYFNALTKLNSIIERAKLANKDDYSKLLSFYSFSLDNTASQKTELDSVIYKSTAGILLHDLRSDWVDNMYMLIGKSYFYKKDFDSAGMTFQYINYNLFPRKKNDDDSKIIGTTDESNAGKISIADAEKRKFLQKILTLPPSRNDALVWYARNLTENNELGEAASLISILKDDPKVPKRLQNDLNEVYAYWFYKQNIYDSAAVYLEKGITNADSKEDKSRWEFLIAQLYELSGLHSKASEYYEKAGKHTADPIMDIFSSLNNAKMLKSSGNIKEIDNSIDKLEKMGKRDKYEAYRDIIFYSAGQMALQKPDTIQALGLFAKSLKHNESNIVYKNKTFLQLADIAYNQKKYRQAFNYYDSLQTGDTTITAKLDQIHARREALLKVVEALNIIEREDSLQRIALMPDRDIFLKQLLKRLRKERGLKEVDFGNESAPITFNSDNNQPIDIFGGNSGKGEWYFYNSSLRSKGQNEFKSKWGNRPNIDNWRRKASLAGSQPVGVNNTGDNKITGDAKSNSEKNTEEELSLENLQKNLPITPDKILASNNLIAENLFKLGKVYQEDLEDYQQAIDTYLDYLKRFPDSLRNGEVYLNLSYCYKKLGNTERENYYKNLLKTKFASSPYTDMLNKPAAAKGKDPVATKAYEEIYNLFIEGKFDEAVAKKKDADVKYSNNYWTPQLLYIEAVQYISRREDSTAIRVLKDLGMKYHGTPMADKASTMIEVLKRRKEIEEYLNRLQITRNEDAAIIVDNSIPTPVTQTPSIPAPPKPAVVSPVTPPPVAVKDTVKKIVPVLTSGAFKMDTGAVHYVIMLLDKVDGVYINEAKNAFTRYNKEKYYGINFDISKDALDGDKAILIISSSSFSNANAAVAYYDKIKKAAPQEVSWLPAAKYSFFIISAENLAVLKTTKDLTAYKKLLSTQYPGKF